MQELSSTPRQGDEDPLRDILYRQLLAGVRVRESGEDHQVDFYRNLGKALISIFGASLSSVVFHSLGRYEGERLSKVLSSSSIPGENWLGMVATFLELQGLAKFQVVELTPKRSDARFAVVNMIDDSDKAYINGEGGGVRCYFTRGLLQKVLEILMGREIQVSEAKCRLHGAEACEYIFSPNQSKKWKA